jgi:magnesium transporter
VKIRYGKPGASPGLLVETDEKPPSELKVLVVSYDHEQLTETEMPLSDVPAPDPSDKRITWIRFPSMPDAVSLAHFGERWGLHPLDLEDVINVGQRPKTEVREDSTFTILQVPGLTDGSLHVRQVSLFLGPNYVISIREDGPPLFDTILKRLHSGTRGGRIRANGADYLFYALLDATVDYGLPITEEVGRTIEDLEESLLEGLAPASLDALHRLRRDLTTLRRSQLPAREALVRLLREEDSPVAKKVRGYMRDVLDHQMQVIDSVEVLRENAISLQELYLSMQGHRLNDVMKVLTIIATIFIPLSFFTGLYGMNFNSEISPWNMPELNTRFGYPVLLLLLAGVAGGMVVFFRRKGWF